MPKPFGASSSRPEAILLAPETPYPLAGGGHMRTASLVEYLRRRYTLQVVTFREPGAPDPASAYPHDVQVHVFQLPVHSRSSLARAWRNTHRAIRNVPPLVDRFAGFERELSELVRQRRYAVGVIEHFWCAPYARVLRPCCQRLILDLHNVESVLLARCAETTSMPARALFQHFAHACRLLENHWYRAFDELLVTSEQDRSRVNGRAIVYPNAIPLVEQPERNKHNEIVFSGNFEYEPNKTAVEWFHQNVWPGLRDRLPDLRWRLVGRNEAGLRKRVAGDARIEVSGPVVDAVAELARARVAVVPLLAGSGTRVKIIEAWAAGLPVVSTSLGAEGLPYTPGRQLVIANSGAQFAGAVEAILENPELGNRLGAAGRLLYEQHLTWPVAWRTLAKSRI